MSSFFVFAARTRTFVLTLVVLASPRGDVCLRVTLGVTGILMDSFFFSRGEPGGGSPANEDTPDLGVNAHAFVTTPLLCTADLHAMSSFVTSGLA